MKKKELELEKVQPKFRVKLPAWVSMAATSVVAIIGAGLQQAKAVFVPIEVDVTDPIAQVTATAGDILPFVLAVAAAGIVFGLIRRWLHA